MNKLVAVVFPDEATAYQGVGALAQMNDEASVDVAAVCVVTKAPDGTVSSREVTDYDFPIRTLAGTSVGALAGALGGPVGFGAGAVVGAFAGLMGDLFSYSVDADFVSDVEAVLTPGKCAVVAEVEEEWVTPLDTRMEALGGVVYRTFKSAVREDQWKREAAAARQDLAQLRIEAAQSRAERKAKLQARIENLTKRIDAKLARAQARSQQDTRDYEAKVRALQQKADKQKGDAKAAVEARIAKLRQDYQSAPHA